VPSPRKDKSDSSAQKTDSVSDEIRSSDKKKSAKRPNSAQTIDFSKWLDLAVTNSSLDRLETALSQLNPESQVMAREILSAISDSNSRPSVKFKVEKIPPDSLQKLLKRVQNPFFLTALLCSSATANELKKSILACLGKSEIDVETCEYVIKKLKAIKERSTKSLVWNELLRTAFLLNGAWKVHQLRFIEWSLDEELKPDEPFDAFRGLTSAAEDFRDLDTSHKNRIFKKLVAIDMPLYLSFLVTTAMNSPSREDVERHLGKEKLRFLHAFLDMKKSAISHGIQELENKYAKGILKSTLDQLMTFEELLPFILKSSLLVDLVPADTLPRAVARVYRRGDELSQLFADKRVAQLESKLADQASELNDTRAQLEAERMRANSSESAVVELQRVLAGYEERLRTQMQSENVGGEAVRASARAELLSSLVDFLDPLAQGDGGLALEKALQKFGLQRLGEPGLSYAWNPELCETLTGEPLSEGLVIRSGYTWMGDGKTIVVRRVLLKSK